MNGLLGNLHKHNYIIVTQFAKIYTDINKLNLGSVVH